MTSLDRRRFLHPKVARNLRPSAIAVWVVVAIITFAILNPILRLIGLAFIPDGALSLDVFKSVVGAGWFPSAVLNTLVVVTCASFLAVLIGGLLTWVNERTDASLGWFGQILPLTPLVVPAVAVAIGWVVLAAPRVGFLRLFTRDIEWLDRMFPNIYSLPGLIFVLTIVMIPYIFLLLQSAFRNLDPGLEEASLVSGAGVMRTVIKVSLPAMRHALMAAILLAAVVGIAEYAIPTIIGTPAGIDILSVRTVRFVTATYPAELGSGAVMGIIMMIATGIIWFLYFRVARAGRFSQISGKPTNSSAMRLGIWKWPIRIAMLAFLVITTILPIVALLIVALQPFWTPNIDPSRFGLQNVRAVFNNPQLAESFFNSIRFAAVGAAIAVALVAGLTAAGKIGKLPSANIGLGVMKIPAAVANVVLGVGFLIAFYGPPFNLGGSAILLVGAYVLIYLPHGSIVGEAATAQVRDELIESSEVSGASRWRTQRKVLLPLTLPGLLAAYALLFALMAAEVSVSRMLARPGTTVVGFSILQVYESGGFGQLSVLAVLTSLVILAVVTTALWIGTRLRNRW